MCIAFLRSLLEEVSGLYVTMISCSLLDRSSWGYYNRGSREEFHWAGRDWMEPIDFESGGLQTLLFHLCINLAVLCPAAFGAVLRLGMLDCP